MESESEDAIKVIQGNLIDVVMEDLVALSPDKAKVSDIPTVANYFKQYLGMHRGLNIDQIPAEQLYIEILKFQSGFPLITFP